LLAIAANIHVRLVTGFGVRSLMHLNNWCFWLKQENTFFVIPNS